MGGEGPGGRNILSFQEVYSKFQNTNIMKGGVSVSKSKMKIKHTKNAPFRSFQTVLRFRPMGEADHNVLIWIGPIRA